jgi:hypothetical protein
MDTTPDLARVAADLDAAKHRAARAVARADIQARLEKRLDGRAAGPGRGTGCLRPVLRLRRPGG